jgi:hypothetical protein
MSRTMMILHAIVTAFVPLHRHSGVPKQTPIDRVPVALARDAEELEQGAREQNERSTCFLIATAERILLGRPPEDLNGHGEHRNGPG